VGGGSEGRPQSPTGLGGAGGQLQGPVPGDGSAAIAPDLLSSLERFSLVQVWVRSGSGLVQFGSGLVQVWFSLAQVWFRTGSGLVQVWFRSGSSLVQVWFSLVQVWHGYVLDRSNQVWHGYVLEL